MGTIEDITERKRFDSLKSSSIAIQELTHKFDAFATDLINNVAPQVVTMRAYEVYCEVFRPQDALVTGGCRGGFGIGELVAFLYARSFPKAEWDARFHEALRGLTL